VKYCRTITPVGKVSLQHMMDCFVPRIIATKPSFSDFHEETAFMKRTGAEHAARSKCNCPS